MYIEVQDRFYKVRDYKDAVTTLRQFSFSKFNRNNEEYKKATSRRYEEVFGMSPIDTKTDKDFILSLVKAGEIRVSKSKPRNVGVPDTKKPASKKKIGAITLKG